MPRRGAYASLMVAGLNLGGCHKKPDPTLVYVSAESRGEIVVVDPDHGSVAARIAVGKRPRGLRVVTAV